MKIRAQIGMVLNLDKCIGCHTCSVTCKNVWTNREGMEYAWFNNVETKPGIGYPRDWENQTRWKGGWTRKRNGRIQPRIGSKWRILANIFANPDLPEIDDYYEPFTFDYEHLQKAPELEAFPTARPRSLISGKRMEKIEWGPNWEEILGGEFAKRSVDANFEGVQKEMYGQFENTFMMYLPRLDAAVALADPAAVPLVLVLPLLRVADAGLGLDVVEPGVLDALAAGPDVLAGDTAGMAADALVQVQHHADLCADFHANSR